MMRGQAFLSLIVQRALRKKEVVRGAFPPTLTRGCGKGDGSYLRVSACFALEEACSFLHSTGLLFVAKQYFGGGGPGSGEEGGRTSASFVPRGLNLVHSPSRGPSLSMRLALKG
jgi:hypothetical protein